MATDAEAGRPGAAPAPRPRTDLAPRGGGNPVSRFIHFTKESAAELKKVEWPSQNQTIQGTVVVLVACVIVGTFLWVNDQVWKEVVKKLLGQ
jgi:preprotein translocase subunit SecE